MDTLKVLLVGIDPYLIDFSLPEFSGFPGLNAPIVEAGIKDAVHQLNMKGFETDLCWTDFGVTAADVLRKKLQQTSFDIILIGSVVRIPEHFLMFEQLLNVILQNAPKASICFNTTPGDTVAAVNRCAKNLLTEKI